jgi:hypothetical protein
MSVVAHESLDNCFINGGRNATLYYECCCSAVHKPNMPAFHEMHFLLKRGDTRMKCPKINDHGSLVRCAPLSNKEAVEESERVEAKGVGSSG